MVWAPIFDNTYYYSAPQFVTYSSDWVSGHYEEDDEGDQVWVDGHYNNIYSWRSEFCGADEKPDYGKMMGALYDYFLSENIEFRHPKYSNGAPYNLKDKAALEKLNADNELSLIYNNESDFCYKLSTTNNTKATRIDGYSISNMNTLFVGSNDSVWGIPDNWNSKQVLTQLINKDGKRDLYIPESMKNRLIFGTVKPADSYVYFCADISTTGQEAGYQNIYRFSYNDPETVENLFQSMRDRNPAYMEVFSYALSGDYLYFGGTQGLNILTGKIDLRTLYFTEIAFGLKVTAMVNY
jgi:hypothetical protein